MKEFTIGLIAVVIVVLSCTDSSDNSDYYGASSGTSADNGTSSGTSSSESSDGSEASEIDWSKYLSSWSSISFRADEMTGEQSFGAHSRSVGSTQRMEWPYNDVRAQVFFQCDSGTENEHAWIRFTTSPNLVGDETRSGYNLINTRIRWDEKAPESATLTQDWGSEDLNFHFDQWAVNGILAHEEMLLELNWYGSGRVHFWFDLVGSSAAIEEARAECRGA